MNGTSRHACTPECAGQGDLDGVGNGFMAGLNAVAILMGKHAEDGTIFLVNSNCSCDLVGLRTHVLGASILDKDDWLASRFDSDIGT